MNNKLGRNERNRNDFQRQGRNDDNRPWQGGSGHQDRDWQTRDWQDREWQNRYDENRQGFPGRYESYAQNDFGTQRSSGIVGGRGNGGSSGSQGYGSGYGNNYGVNTASSGSLGTSENYGAGNYGTTGSYGMATDIGARGRSYKGLSNSGERTSFSGRGPKGYTRTDERIREDVCDRLSQDDEVDASEIEVRVENGEVILEGTVQTRSMKHDAEDIAESVYGVKDVRNNVRVTKPILTELKDKITGKDSEEHYANTGTKNAPTSTSSSSTHSRP